MLRSWLPLPLLVAGSVASAPAQDAATAHVVGFAGLAWGVREAEVVETLGVPLRADTLEVGITVLAYPGTFADTSVVALYAFTPAEGLVKGQYTLRFGPEDDCVALFRRFRGRLLLAYPLIVPEDRSFNDSGAGFCSSVVAGTAGWLTTWEDEDTGARASVSIEAGQARVNAVFESAAFRSWLARQAPANPQDGARR